MTRLLRLRHQMLIAMGLPACWTQSTPATNPTPRETPSTTATIASSNESAWRRGDCRADAVFETICGSVDTAQHHASCGPTADSLQSFGTSHLYVTRHDMTSQQSRLAPFELDDAATAAYRPTLQGLDPSWLVSYCCYSRCTPMKVSRAVALQVPPRHHVENQCIPAPSGGTRQPDENNPACPDAVELAGAPRNYVEGDRTHCCYGIVVADPDPQQQRHYRGRAARIDGVPQVADVGAGAAWRVPVDLAALPAADVRARLAAHWLETARMEHASIAAFANLSLRLLALGAPPELVAGAHAAALDEIEHARIAFELASSYADTPLQPVTFAAAAQLSATGTLADLARETFVDGCIGETVAALEAELGAASATDPAVARALATIAADETRHAQLAWSIVAWCVRREPTLRADLRALCDVPCESLDGDDLVAHGVLGARSLAAVRADVIRDVVTPCLDQLS